MLDYLGQHFTQPAKITEGARANVYAYPPSFEPEIISVLRETLVRSFSPGIREVLAFRRETPLPTLFKPTLQHGIGRAYARPLPALNREIPPRTPCSNKSQSP